MSESRRPRIDPSIIAALIGLVGTIIVTIISVRANRPDPPQATPMPTPFATNTTVPSTVVATIISTQVINLEDQVVLLRQDIANLQNRLSAYDQVDQHLNNIGNRLSVLEQAIEDSPDQAAENIII